MFKIISLEFNLNIKYTFYFETHAGRVRFYFGGLTALAVSLAEAPQHRGSEMGHGRNPAPKTPNRARTRPVLMGER